MTAKGLLAELRAQGVKVRTEVIAGGELVLKLRPIPSAGTLGLVKRLKDKIILELAQEGADYLKGLPSCPMCRRPMAARKCWHCHVSLCECGRPTESAFISVCRACEVAEARRTGQPI